MTNLPINQVLLGDCIELMDSLPAGSIDLIFADPPYNMQLSGDLFRPNQSKVDAVDDRWDKFASMEDYDRFTEAWLRAARRVLSDTGTLWVIGSYHNIYRVGRVLMDLEYWILNDIVWVKANPTPQMKGVRFCNAHETLLWAKKSADQPRYTFHYREMKAGNEDLQMRSDWYFPVCQGEERRMLNGEKAHTTQKPEALLHRIIMATSNEGDVVLDPFCGTGTTAAVAKRLGRSFITIDREEGYVQVARERVDAEVCAQTADDPGALIGGPKPRVPFISLVESGQLPVGSRLRLNKSQTYAVVQADGTLTAEGHRGSIHQLARALLGPPNRNGWENWFFQDPKTNQFEPIDALRPAAGPVAPQPGRFTNI